MDQKPEDYISSSMAKNSTFPDQINPMMQQNNMIFDIPSNYIEVSNNNNLGFMEMLGFQDHHDFSYPTSIWDLVINDYHQVVVPVPPPPSLQVPSLSQTHTQSQPPPLLSPASEVVNTPVTPNSSVSISSSSAEGSGAAAAAPIPNHHDQQMRTESEKELQEDQENTKQLLKPKKKNQKKKPKEARYAFKTKSEVEHLDDGYRWRKYGQKAVKNSPFPRSYYRCTTPTCGVKKRIERSSEDPTIVVTTYEGSHTHPYPITGRGSLSLIGAVASEPSTPTTTFGDGCDPCGGGAGSSSFLMPQMLHYHQSQVQPHEQQQPPFYQQDPTANLNFSGTNANHQQQLHPQQPYFQQDSTTNLNFNGTNPNVNVNPMTSLVNLFQERRFCPPSTRDGGLLQDILPSKMLIKNPIPKQGTRL